MNLGAKEMMTDMRQSEKHLATAYCQAEIETANQSLSQ